MGNSEFVRQHGLEIFMEEQKEKYTCLKCCGIILNHDRECSECQERLDKFEFCKDLKAKLKLVLLSVE